MTLIINCLSAAAIATAVGLMFTDSPYEDHRIRLLGVGLAYFSGLLTALATWWSGYYVKEIVAHTD
mgnify:CR=1 FL=1